MKARETFERIRNQKNNKFNLKYRFITLVSASLTASILISLAVSHLLNQTIPFIGLIPQSIKLIVLSIVVSIVGTYFISKWVYDPLKQLRLAMEKVADGDFTVRIDEQSSLKEIQEVYAGFNLMTHELSTTAVLQDDFVSNVSHEFKTPIAAIEGYSTLLQDDENFSDEQKEYVEKIFFNTRRLSGLVSNILLLSKLEHQSIETGQAWYRLDEQIRESIVALEPAWSGREIDFDVEMDEIKYLGNENLLRHVWDNLIGNAVKFSPQRGLVRIRLTKRESRFIFTVEDQGPGIPDESQKRIFDKFFQADSSHKQEGYGLGLSLVKRILMITGGGIEVENIPAGGCRFTVTLEE